MTVLHRGTKPLWVGYRAARLGVREAFGKLA
jgi:hypothetical protein